MQVGLPVKQVRRYSLMRIKFSVVAMVLLLCGKAVAVFIAWSQSAELNQSLFEQIQRGAALEAAQRKTKVLNGGTPIYPEGWLSQRRWEDESPDLSALVVPGTSASRSDITRSVMNVQDTNW